MEEQQTLSPLQSGVPCGDAEDLNPKKISAQIRLDMKRSLQQGDRLRLGTIRMLLAAIKQREIDERIQLDDQQVVAVINHMIKQRRDSLAQYLQAQRQDLADQESAEIAVLEDYLPPPLAAAAVEGLITQAITAVGASSIRDMTRVMDEIKRQAQGRIDVRQVSEQVKRLLASSS